MAVSSGRFTKTETLRKVRLGYGRVNSRSVQKQVPPLGLKSSVGMTI